MTLTIQQAFDVFLRDHVNLDPRETQKARKSRDWLLRHIYNFPSKVNNFPTLYTEKNIFFGSFARRTKIRELDDIDIMIALSAESNVYIDFPEETKVNIINNNSKLTEFCFEEEKDILSSRKVINKIVRSLNKIPQYENADIKRNHEAATLKLNSYPWNFDLVPCFFTDTDKYNRDYYLIPDGNGNWKKTDPRIDRKLVTETNQSYEGGVLDIIRLAKYWNRRPTKPSMSSYLIENITLNFYKKFNRLPSRHKGFEFIDVLNYISREVYNPVPDPKNIQGNINCLDYEQKYSISNRAILDYQKAFEAYKSENKGLFELANKKWRDIFGNNFPIL